MAFEKELSMNFGVFKRPKVKRKKELFDGDGDRISFLHNSRYTSINFSGDFSFFEPRRDDGFELGFKSFSLTVSGWIWSGSSTDSIVGLASSFFGFFSPIERRFCGFSFGSGDLSFGSSTDTTVGFSSSSFGFFSPIERRFCGFSSGSADLSFGFSVTFSSSSTVFLAPIFLSFGFLSSSTSSIWMPQFVF